MEGKSAERVVELAYLNSSFETGQDADAVLEHTHIETTGWNKIDEVPFDFER